MKASGTSTAQMENPEMSVGHMNRSVRLRDSRKYAVVSKLTWFHRVSTSKSWAIAGVCVALTNAPSSALSKMYASALRIPPMT
jgi:hypothetical protein